LGKKRMQLKKRKKTKKWGIGTASLGLKKKRGPRGGRPLFGKREKERILFGALGVFGSSSMRTLAARWCFGGVRLTEKCGNEIGLDPYLRKGGGAAVGGGEVLVRGTVIRRGGSYKSS